ncbi:sensor histidine kinase, HAMP and GAF domain-containing [Syntrophotalea carbinolica DSM 2380]|uniref:histidine kinase n=1 Tax=Syntrophotalea carbinolica (strain DSM 2380 / NBRC 103641 / GraBd1) TaxID=338963 RepID=Q3A5U5_SYNC1|nr:HAMP domain-containing protein [Syntrophotalea carbinolica]ABA88262.1 sensor histidine kinase, HAMP and GAF domain-containing [Syntrophotalea carbinolica DSM 2380]
MSFLKNIQSSTGLAPRIAFLSWLLALITLLTFVLLTIPQQKEILIRNLESKANGVAVSLHDVAAGAAINDDLASVVTACQTLLAGDPDLEFLIITKNDGFSLVNQQTGWRVEPQIDSYWVSDKRIPQGKITTVPLLNQRVFHFAKPFDYSGIEWGWIHVGLSLKDHDHSVATLYRNTIGLILACLLLSLHLALFYARKIVRPILRLKKLVQKIADGDLTVRADVNRRDELGDLAQSVNTMTDSLLRRDRILESVRFAAQLLLRTEQWGDSIHEVLAKLGQAAKASRAYLYENIQNDTGQICSSRRYVWETSSAALQTAHSPLELVSYDHPDLEKYRKKLANNRILSGVVSDKSSGLRALLEPLGIRSVIVIPVFVNNIWWGFLGLDDCDRCREWTEAEKDSLRAAAEMLGATIARQGIRDALLEAKATLEDRVKERTLELQTQVAAKEKALSELAEAQSTLVEVSRAAGMTEVATGVLHNVGNVLNSVNVSSTLIIDLIKKSRVGNIAKVAELIQDHTDCLPEFLSQDARGSQIPVYLSSLALSLQDEQTSLLKETESLRQRIDHIKEIISMQQSYGRVGGVDETVYPDQLMEDALKLNANALERHGISVQRQYRHDFPIVTDKHRVLQILLNLINNAKHACCEIVGEKNITLQIEAPDPEHILFQVTDTGIGIPQENLTRIFQHGFTTRKTGHGYGLHSGALTARELGGSLAVHSDGPNTGATFTLILPIHPKERA